MPAKREGAGPATGPAPKRNSAAADRVRPEPDVRESPLTAALDTARLGFRVFPLAAGLKVPTAGSRGFLDASADAEAVATAFGAHPGAGLGIATGAGLLVLDVDPQHGGTASLDTLQAEHGALPKGYRVRTPSGGSHHYFRVPAGVLTRSNAGQLAAGIDLRGDGGYVVAAPTVLADGRRYRVKKALTLPALDALPLAPGWLLEAARRPEPTAATAAQSRGWGELDAAERAHVERARPRLLAQQAARLDALGAAATPRPEDYRGEPWDATVHAVACELARIARMPSPDPAAALRRARAVLTVHAPTDQGFGEADHERIWRSALHGTEGQAADPGLQPLEVPESAPAETVTPREQRGRLDAAHATFRRWLGPEYDLDAIDAALAAAAVERLEGDPLWLMLISGSGAAKTETAQALAGAGAQVVSSISSAGALLSATSRRERSSAATGGLLRRIGDHGVLVIKDFTSLIGQHREARDEVMAALREVYDGRWVRVVGTDGGQELPWQGRLVIVGACTTAWDSANAVLGAMGDRFALLRIDSASAGSRRAASRQAIANRGHEERMRAELAEAAGLVLAGVRGGQAFEPTDAERDALEAAADLVTLARTAVERDYRGDVVNAHAPEMGTRFGKQLAQVLRGGIAVGLDRPAALALALRIARDSIPPGRWAALLDVAQHPNASTHEVQRRLGKPRASVDRELQTLNILGVLTVAEEPTFIAGREGTRWRYTLADGLAEALSYLSAVPDVSVYGHENTEVGRGGGPLRPPADGSGTARARCRACSDSLITPTQRAAGLCAKQDDAHRAAALLDGLDLVAPATTERTYR